MTTGKEGREKVFMDHGSFYSWIIMLLWRYIPSVCSFHKLRTLSCENSRFSILALWGNKNGLPSMKVKELEKFLDKMGLKGCKWSSLNAPGTETPQSHPYWELGEFPFSIISPLG